MKRHTIELREGADLEGFRAAVRALVTEDAHPDSVLWTSAAASSMFAPARPGDAPPVALPRAAAELIQSVVCHSDAERYALLYRLIWRLRNGEPRLLEIPSDPLIARLALLQKAIRTDLHKMHAFVRFRGTTGPTGEERFVAWFEPSHFILEEAAGFFVSRFRNMTWSILTPIGSLHWDRTALTVGPAATRADAPDGDPFEDCWSSYYAGTFNPARLNTKLMRQHMPARYWRNMPETASIADLVRDAPSRVVEMIEREASMPNKRNPDKAVAAMQENPVGSLDELNRIIASAAPFVAGGTRAVLGEGPTGADLAFVGEQPGDQEDTEGRPFVGPAGRLLDRALADAGIERSRCYLTNAVKHFKFVQRGKRRLHQNPTAGEIRHYRWWLEKEIELVAPRIVVALGASAALALSGRAVTISKSRGPAQFSGRAGYISVHPSYLLRLSDPAARESAYGAFVQDLARAKDAVAQYRVA